MQSLSIFRNFCPIKTYKSYTTQKLQDCKMKVHIIHQIFNNSTVLYSLAYSLVECSTLNVHIITYMKSTYLITTSVGGFKNRQ